MSGGRTGRRHVWQLAVGAALLVASLAVAGGLWYAADQLYDDNVAGFARAPVGCDTTLEFDSSGEFILYVESTGRLEVASGGCEADESYASDRAAIPEVQLLLRTADGQDLELAADSSISYDTGDFVGISQQRVDIQSPGEHLLTVAQVDSPGFAVAIGRDPSNGVGALRWGAVASVIGGMLVGGLFLLLGSRRTPVAIGQPDPWQPASPMSGPDPQWPAGPPGFPIPPPTTGAAGVAGPTRVRPTRPADSPTAPPNRWPPDTPPVQTPVQSPPARPQPLQAPEVHPTSTAIPERDSPSPPNSAPQVPDAERSPWAPPRDDG